MDIKPSLYTQAILELEGKPFSLKDQPYMNAIYDLDPPEMLTMMARQVAKSVTQAAKIIGRSTAIPHYYSLYVTPTAKQVSVFSNDRLKPMVVFSPLVKKYFVDHDSNSAVTDKSFSNGSRVHLRSCYLTADTMRGVTADFIAIDEAQDIAYDNIFVIREAGSARPRPVTIYSGTPKTLNNTLGRLWKRSTQNEWVIKCVGCNHYNIPGIGNIGKEGLICSKCGKAMDYRWGVWMQTNRSAAPGAMPGFRLPQICTPFHQPLNKWKILLSKLEEGNQVVFYNEVLALPYSISQNPVTEEDIQACCNSGRAAFDTVTEYMNGEFRSVPLYAGVDYGRGSQSFTVLSIVGRVAGKSRLFYAKKFTGFESDPMHYMSEIVDTCRAWNVRAIGADSGDGSMQNSYLRNQFGFDRVMIFSASDNLGQLIKYKPESAGYTFNRTRNLQNRFVQIKNKLIEFPNFRMFKPFSDMITCVFIDYSKAEDKVYYDHDGENEPDDFLHSWNYAEMTSHVFNGGLATNQ